MCLMDVGSGKASDNGFRVDALPEAVRPREANAVPAPVMYGARAAAAQRDRLERKHEPKRAAGLDRLPGFAHRKG